MLFEDFEKYLKYDRQLAETTIHNYNKCLRDFRSYMNSDMFRSENMLDIQRDEVRDYLIHIRESNPGKPYVLPNSIIAMRSFFNWLAYTTKRNNIIEISFYLSKIVKVKKNRSLPIVPTAQDVAQLRKTINAYKTATSFAKNSTEYKRTVRELAIVELFITTGIRNGELRNLTYEDVNLEEKTIFIRKSKNNSQRLSIFNVNTLAALKDYFETTNFKSEDILFPMKQGNVVNFIIKRWAKRAAISKDLHAHSFRHFFISESQRRGVPVMIVAKQVGHRDLNSTMYYTHTDIDTVRQNYKDCEI